MPAFPETTHMMNEACTFVRHELQATLKGHAAPADDHEHALQSRIDQIEAMLLAIQKRQEHAELLARQEHAELMARQEEQAARQAEQAARQEAHQAELLAKQAEQHAELLAIAQRQKAHHHEVMSALHKVLAAVRLQTGVLQGMLHGDSECPRYMMVLPLQKKAFAELAPPKSKRKSAEKESKCLLQFVDPVTMTSAGSGFELKHDESELDDCAPALSVALGALKMISEASADHRFGLTLAQSEDEHQVIASAYEKVKAKLAENDQSSFFKINEELLDGTLHTMEELPEEYVEAVQDGYAAVTELLHRLTKGVSWEEQIRDPKKCGLVRAVHPVDGVEWVAAKYQLLYELKGRAIIGMAREELEAAGRRCDEAATTIGAAQRGRVARKEARARSKVKSAWVAPYVAALDAAHRHAAHEREAQRLAHEQQLGSLEAELRHAAHEREAQRLKHEQQLFSLEAELSHLEEALRAEMQAKQAAISQAAAAEARVSEAMAESARMTAQGLLEVEQLQAKLAAAKLEVATLAGDKDELVHVTHKLSQQVAQIGMASRRRFL
ncbi:hypothetical protein AB1Y20_013970 [Prymnesium parvum]|uniref:Uncharacterized protein n=1 Tax=Prymnesium parvum TaxID=97485 RepID=A0AB34IHI7_PRYPA